jgi:hypothetical protein
MMNDAIHPTYDLAAYASGSLGAETRVSVERHLGACEACRRELASWGAVSEAVRLDLATVNAQSPALVTKVWAKIDADTSIRTDSWYKKVVTMVRAQRQSLIRPLIGLGAAAGIVAALLLTPLGSYAEDFLTIFTPKQFVAVPVSESDLQALPDLSEYGTMTASSHPDPVEVDSAAAATAASGMRVLVPSSLPPSVTTSPRYGVTTGGHNATFTFSAEKAQAAAAARGVQLPPMPANIDGSSIQVLVGPVAFTTYPAPENAQIPIPSLLIGQTTAPVVQSTGVSVLELQQYLLSQPGVSPQLAQAIRSLGDPSTTMPIPIPLDMAASHPVQVQGVSGLAVSGASGFGAGIIWQKDGHMFGVAGPLSEAELLAVANSLR